MDGNGKSDCEGSRGEEWAHVLAGPPDGPNYQEFQRVMLA